MRHDLHLEGAAYSLRPVTLADAAAIVELRSDPERARWLNAVSPDVGRQRDWLQAYLEREGDYYFAVTDRSSGAPEGFVGIYDVTRSGADAVAEWGRWVLKRGSLAAPESALLVYRLAFGPLELGSVYCRTVRDNAAVVSFHDRLGPASRTLLPGNVVLRDEARDHVEHRFSREDLPRIEGILGPLAARIAARRAR